MIQTFHAVPIRAAIAVSVPISTINGLNDNTTAALEIDADFEWLLQTTSR